MWTLLLSSPLTALVKQFGRFAALRGVSAEFAAGRLYAILGDNGAGKTTLLRVLAGLAQPTRGSISDPGHDRPAIRVPRTGLHGASVAALRRNERAWRTCATLARLYGISDDSDQLVVTR